MKNYKHISHPSSSSPKTVEVEGLGRVTLKSYEGARHARLEGSSFPLSASGANDQEAVDNLKAARAVWVDRLSDSD